MNKGRMDVSNLCYATEVVVTACGGSRTPDLDNANVILRSFEKSIFMQLRTYKLDYKKTTFHNVSIPLPSCLPFVVLLLVGQ